MVSYGEKRRLVKKPKSGVKRISIEKYSPGNELYVVDIKRIKKAAARIAFKDYPAEQTQLVPQIIEAVNKVHKPYDGKVTLNEHGLEVVCRELKVPKSYLRAVKSRNISKASSQLKHYPDCQIIIKSGSSKRRWSIVHTAHVHDSHDGSHSQDPPTIPPVIRRRK